jgi:amino acid transporter
MNTYLTVTRSIVSVIIGYLIFALTAFGLFQISGQPPHQAAPLWFMLGTVIYGCVFALIGGYVAAWLCKRRPIGIEITDEIKSAL